MPATIYRIGGLRGANLAAFRKAADLIEANLRRETCAYCGGAGKFLGVVDGKWATQRCANCAGSGVVTVET